MFEDQVQDSVDDATHSMDDRDRQEKRHTGRQIDCQIKRDIKRTFSSRSEKQRTHNDMKCACAISGKQLKMYPWAADIYLQTRNTSKQAKLTGITRNADRRAGNLTGCLKER